MNKRVGISSVLLALERVAKLFPTKPEPGDNSWFGQPLLFNSNIKAIRPLGNKLEKRIITNEYLALPAELNLNLNEIYGTETLLTLLVTGYFNVVCYGGGVPHPPYVKSFWRV